MYKIKNKYYIYIYLYHSTSKHQTHSEMPHFNSSPRCCSRKAGIEGLAFNVTKPLILWYLGWFHGPMDRQEIANFIEVLFVTHFHVATCGFYWKLPRNIFQKVIGYDWLTSSRGPWNWRKPHIFASSRNETQAPHVLQFWSLDIMPPLFAKQEHV